MNEVLKIVDYSFTYSGVTRPALQHISLEVGRKEIAIIAGPSGCGKSTLLRSINGLIPHMYLGARIGSVMVEGVDVSLTSISESSKKVGYVFQNPENQIFMFSVERDIAFGLENLGLPRNEIRERVDWAMDLLNINELAHRPPHELSDGQKQRVAIAGVLAMKPSILILDEPTSLLDPHTAQDLIGTVRKLRDQLDITVLVVEHRLDLLAQIASRVVVMDGGEIVLDGTPRDVLSKKEALLVGISVPSATRIYSLVSEEGVPLGSPCLSADELAERINDISHD